MGSQRWPMSLLSLRELLKPVNLTPWLTYIATHVISAQRRAPCFCCHMTLEANFSHMVRAGIQGHATQYANQKNILPTTSPRPKILRAFDPQRLQLRQALHGKVLLQALQFGGPNNTPLTPRNLSNALGFDHAK